MTPESKTPRTDAEIAKSSYRTFSVSADFARELETELRQSVADGKRVADDNDRLLGELSAAQAQLADMQRALMGTQAIVIESQRVVQRYEYLRSGKGYDEARLFIGQQTNNNFSRWTDEDADERIDIAMRQERG